MKADFSGWATKAGLKCSDGRTIMPDAFKDQDQITVPLVWQHGHTDIENVLGHAVLTNKPEGVWCDAYFNETPKAQHAKEAVGHKDITKLSIWANELVERAGKVLHGAIREVSLVLAGANPGAVIETVAIKHSDGMETVLDDEAIIYTDLDIVLPEGEKEPEPIAHAAGDDDETVEDVYNSMTDKQKQVVHYLIGEAVANQTAEHSALSIDDDTDVKELVESLHDNQKQALQHMMEEAIKASGSETDPATTSEGTEMKHNVFETQDADGNKKTVVLSHSLVSGIFADATAMGGSFKEAVETAALKHGIDNIDVLFPDAKTIDNIPELFGRRTEWVNVLMNGVRKSPFARVKTVSADITLYEARAKGYVKGDLKKEEFFEVTARSTEPQTIYKKQKLDRDDMIDITDFDVVAWLKGEMRIMLDEEVARAILVGDGREPGSEDKIRADRIRPIAFDHELYTTRINVNISDADSSIEEALDQIVLNRHLMRGTGLPTLFTTEQYIARMLLLKDQTGRKIYKNLDEIATDLRLSAIVPVEILQEYEDIFGVLVNPVDYVVGTNRGGQVSMFDDFDIDYNQYKYLIETRLSGALVKLKAAMVITVTAANSVEVTPAEPLFDGQAITIVDTAGVVYRNAATDAVMTAAGSPYAVADGQTVNIQAEPAANYHFPSSEVDDWSFTGVAP